MECPVASSQLTLVKLGLLVGRQDSCYLVPWWLDVLLDMLLDILDSWRVAYCILIDRGRLSWDRHHYQGRAGGEQTV